jgi:hypothetical protein
MRLHIIPFASAAAIVTAVVYSICVLLLAVWPAWAYPLFSFLLHMDLTPSVYPMSWSVYFGGLVGWVVVTWLAVAGFAGLHNALMRQPR